MQQLFGADSVVTDITFNRGIPSRALNKEPNGFFCFLNDCRVLHKQRTPWQAIEVVEHPWFKRALILDNVIQFSTRFQDIYTGALSDIVMDRAVQGAQGRPVNVLVIGGGDGRITKHLVERFDAQIARIWVVDIDEQVTAVCKEFFPSNTLFESEKCEWV